MWMFERAASKSSGTRAPAGGKNFFEDTLGESFIDADDLIDAIGQNDNWFKLVFQKVE